MSAGPASGGQRRCPRGPAACSHPRSGETHMPTPLRLGQVLPPMPCTKEPHQQALPWSQMQVFSLKEGEDYQSGEMLKAPPMSMPVTARMLTEEDKKMLPALLAPSSSSIPLSAQASPGRCCLLALAVIS